MTFSARFRAAARADGGVLLTAVLFFVLSAIWLGSTANYHGDERFYTDAALRMLEKRAWFTPEYANGEMRLNKPLLSYWVLIGTYVTLGTSLFLSRLPFLLMGTGVVWLTGRLARVLFPGEPRVALLAAAIAASDVGIVTLARRSTPDIVLVLFTTAALYGLARVVVGRDAGAGARAWLWIGIGAMVAAKGGLGVLALAFTGLCWLALRSRGVRARDFVHAPSMIAGLALAGAGLAGNWIARDRQAADSLLRDQVASRLADSASEVLAQAGNYGGSLLRHFAPWLALLVVAAVVGGPTLRDRYVRHRRAFGLALAWLALVLVVFSCANTHRGRYLVPAHPLLACVVAAWLADAARFRVVHRLAWTPLLLMALATAALTAALIRIDGPTAASAGVCAVLAGAAAWKSRAGEPALALVGLALGILAVSTVGVEGVRELVARSPVPEALSRLQRTVPPPTEVAVLDMHPEIASQVRVMSHRAIAAVSLPASVPDAELRRHRTWIVSDASSGRLGALGFTLERCGSQPAQLDARTGWEFLTAPDPLAWLRDQCRPVYLVR